MASNPTSPAQATRSSADTKARIIAVAQGVFAAKGYSHAGLREIATMAEVAPSLVIKYFGTKARLFEEALGEAIIPIPLFQRDRARLGEQVVASVLDRAAPMHAPAMIALALGDPESRAIVQRVVDDRIVAPMAEWIGADRAKAKALNLLAMTTGFSIFHRNMDPALTDDERAQCGALFARSLQDMVDAP